MKKLLLLFLLLSHPSFAGYITQPGTGGTGDIEGVTAGTNLTGGGATGTVTLNVANPLVGNVTGDVTGNVTGNTSGTAATITGLLTTANIAKVDVMDGANFCADAGANDTYACSLSPAATAYVTGTHYRFKANTANTGTASINFNSLGAKTIVKAFDGAITTVLVDNDILAGQWVDLVYDGTNMQMQNPRGIFIGETVLASLPAAGTAGRFRWVTDCESETACDAGLLSTRILHYDDGTSWIPLFATAVTPTLTQVMGAGNTYYGAISPATGLIIGQDANHYVVIYYNASTGVKIKCVELGIEGNCNHAIELNSGYVRETSDSAGQVIERLAESTGLLTYPTASKAPKKSVWFGAGALSTDGTQCASPAEVTINSGAKRWTIICTDNDAATIYGEASMPDSWDGGTVTFAHHYIQTAADTAVLNGDIAASCRLAGATIDNTWGTEIAIDDAAVTGSSALDITTSAAVTPDGTCTAGSARILQFRYQLDATGTTTAVATLHHLGFKIEYSITGNSD